MELVTCPSCNYTFAKDFHYCPMCGLKMESVVSVPLVKQIQLYVISLLFPPFGLFPGIKYLTYKHASAKRVGIIAILLTVVSTLVTIWYLNLLISQINTGINSQLQQYNYLLK